MHLAVYLTSFFFFRAFGQESKCVVNVADLLKVASLYAVNKNVVKIKILASTNYNKDYVKFVDDFIKLIYQSSASNTFLVDDVHVTDHFWREEKNVNIVNFLINPNQTINQPWMLQNFRQKVHKSYLGDVEKLSFILTWEEGVLEHVVEHELSRLFHRSRSTFIIVIANCECKRRYFERILLNLWVKFKAVHVFVFAPGCSETATVFTYNPFMDAGLLEEYNAQSFWEKPVDKLSDLSGYALKTSMFIRTPTIMELKDSPASIRENPIYKKVENILGFGGADGYILANIARHLNFTFQVVSWANRSLYGAKTKNGTFTGLMGDIVYERIDIAANGMFYNIYDASDLLEFTAPITNDLLCVVVPKSEKIPQWVKMFQCFHPKTWISLFGLIILCLFFWRQITPTKQDTVLTIVGIFLTAPTRLPRRSAQRIFLASCMGFTVIITGVFQGSLVKSFSSDSYYADIDSLEELDHSGLHIATSLDVFHSGNPELMKRLESKRVQLNESSMGRAANIRDVAAVERQEDANLLISTTYKKNDGYPMLHLMKKCVSSSYLGYIVPKGCPYLNRLSRTINGFAESGLIEKWYEDVMEALMMESLRNSSCSDEELKPFDLEDVQAAFYILILGQFCATITLVFEIYFGRNNAKAKL